MMFSNGFVLNWIQNLKKIVLLNLISQNGVQKYFFIRKFNGIDLCEVIT